MLRTRAVDMGLARVGGNETVYISPENWKILTLLREEALRKF